MNRRYQIGAEATKEGVSFRVWAPLASELAVVIENHSPVPMLAEENGYFSAVVPWAIPGNRYQFMLDRSSSLLPDPASRYQPDGPFGSSQIVDSNDYAWNDKDWKGVPPKKRIVYEMHIGTFTREGTFSSAIHELPKLAALGITLIEVMPIAEFPGRFGWGYDGVNLWAPSHLYGTPDDVRRFVDAAHAEGMGVLLDVVYNHLGPYGNFLPRFSACYFTDTYKSDWGSSLNFDGPGCEPVREFFSENAAYWIDEFHFDGLRFDATQSIYDASETHALALFARRARQAAPNRELFLVAENETQDARIARRTDQGGYGIDALWNDDFHHSARVALTAKREAYYTDTLGSPQEFISVARWGYLYQGQRYSWQNKNRGSPAFDLGAEAFVAYLENHDQIANSARGARLHQLTDGGRYRALTAFLLLTPSVPMLFQGQEFGSTKPFLYFADHPPDVASAIREGRRAFLAQFSSLASEASQTQIADPGSISTFERCKLDLTERDMHVEHVRLYSDLIRLRQTDPAFQMQRSQNVAGAVLGPNAFVLRYFCPENDRLLVVNLGAHLSLPQIPEPLLAPPLRGRWTTLWSSDDPIYGGHGSAELEGDAGWVVPGHSAVVLG